MRVLRRVASRLSRALNIPDLAPSIGSDRPFRWRKVKFPSHVRVLKHPRSRHHPVVIRPAGDVATVFFGAVATPPYQRQVPQIYAGPDWLEADMASVHELGPVQAPAGGTALLAEVSVLGNGVVVTSDGSVVAESLINTDGLTRFGPFFRGDHASAPHLDIRFGSRQRRLSSPIHVLMKQTYDENYGHWLVECLPKLVGVSQYFDLSTCKFIVSDWKHMKEIYAETLKLFGIEQDQIVEVGYESVHVERLIYPLPITQHGHPFSKSPTVVDVLERISAEVGAVSGPKRLYVSRNRYHKRHLVNEAAVLEICAAHGFEVIYPETMSFAEQVRAFCGAEIVVGNCGAALTNIAFAPRGCTLLALASQVMHDAFFWDLASLKSITYASLHGTPTKDDAGLPYNEQIDLDFEIDIDRFAGLLDDLLHEVDMRHSRREVTPVAMTKRAAGLLPNPQAYVRWQ